MDNQLKSILTLSSKGLLFGLSIGLCLTGAYDIHINTAQGNFSALGVDKLIIGVSLGFISAMVLSWEKVES
ncbi:hypothetical protein [Paraferrimonas sp. SM1919]|uniref:hypothetical protein n=1 Tax=Paraferrimonas sp. SM1919 TaxID=2662263 RepID=UPI0013D6ED2D|nr:hypothetical protein [Paraferrimonas sp. SM1919]